MVIISLRLHQLNLYLHRKRHIYRCFQDESKASEFVTIEIEKKISSNSFFNQ